MRSRTWFGGFALVALTVTMVFLVVPTISIFTDTSPAALIDALGEPVVTDALWLSLKTTVIALIVILLIGTPAAYFLAVREFRGRALVLTLIELPLVMPPAVAGIALLAAFGPQGVPGAWISGAGVELVLQTSGVIVALIFVASPFYLRQAIAAFSSVERRQLEASRTLGAGPFRTFIVVAVPAARPGLSSGVALAWGRALGEFGATLMFAGSLQGVTQTAPLAIFSRFSDPDGFTAALAISSVLIIAAGLILASVKLFGGDRPLEGPGS